MIKKYNQLILDERGPVIQVPFQFLIENNIPINDYILISLIFENSNDLLTLYSQSIENMTSSMERCYESGFISRIDKTKELSFDNIEVSAYYRALFESRDPSKWIDEWYGLWPNGVKSSGYYVKTDKYSCIKKLQRFRRKYPVYSKVIIMDATKNYINRMSLNNYSYMKLAPYFIEKEGMSTLAGECEQLVNSSINENEQKEERFGERDY